MSGWRFKLGLGVGMMLVLAAGAIGTLLAGFTLLTAAFIGGITVGGSTVIALLSRHCRDLDNALQKLDRRSKTLNHDLQSALDDCRRTTAATQALIDALPHVVAFLSPDGTIEMANSRGSWFDMEPGKIVHHGPHEWLKTIVKGALDTRQRTTLHAAPAGGNGQKPIQFFDEGRELFFVPQATPLIDPSTGTVLKILILLMDVSASQKADEAKSSLLSSFSHELKTPMTSIQMSIYLLLDDAADRLTPRQLELLTAARDDSDRLHRVLEKAITEARATW